MTIVYMYTHIHTSGLCRTPRGRILEPHDHSHRRLIRPMENFYQGIFTCLDLLACLLDCLLITFGTYSIRHSRSILHDPNFQNVTITWYRLSRFTVYLSHTLSTFLTPLNQERWSIALWIVDIFDIIKSRTMV